MTNFDHTIDDGLAEALMDDPTAFANYCGWNFCAYVWANGANFVCEIWSYGSPEEIIQAGSLEEIMEAVSESYGYK